MIAAEALSTKLSAAKMRTASYSVTDLAGTLPAQASEARERLKTLKTVLESGKDGAGRAFNGAHLIKLTT